VSTISAQGLHVMTSGQAWDQARRRWCSSVQATRCAQAYAMACIAKGCSSYKNRVLALKAVPSERLTKEPRLSLAQAALAFSSSAASLLAFEGLAGSQL